MSALALLPEAIDDAGLRTVLQPIVTLHNESVLAFEALTRARAGGPGPADLFARAAEQGRAVQLNLAAIRGALATAPCLPPHALLFVNADPVVLASTALPRTIREGSARTGFPLTRLVVEITERTEVADVPATARAIEDLRAWGVRFALDDFGSGYSHLALIDVIRPSFLKIGQGFGTAFEESATARRIVRHIAGLARDFACSTVIEGVESASTARAALDLGIEYAQGFHFGPGREPEAVEKEKEST